MAKVKVEVLAEMLDYSYLNPDGTGSHVLESYKRGAVFEMEEADALKAAEGEEPGAPKIGMNAAKTEVWIYPPKTPGMARAAVRILKHSTEPVTPPDKKEVYKPAPAPKDKA